VKTADMDKNMRTKKGGMPTEGTKAGREDEAIRDREENLKESAG
jgi:hypothetical protein